MLNQFYVAAFKTLDKIDNFDIIDSLLVTFVYFISL